MSIKRENIGEKQRDTQLFVFFDQW